MTITVDRVNELLAYDPDTGILRWRVSRGRVVAGSVAGRINNHGYRNIKIDGRGYQAHRVAFLIMTGRWPHEVDHIDHDRLNNRWLNLREVTRQENKRNAPKQANNTSGHTGVCWDGRHRKWDAKIMINGRTKHVYWGPSLEGAIAARKDAEREYGFHANHGSERNGLSADNTS